MPDADFIVLLAKFVAPVFGFMIGWVVFNGIGLPLRDVLKGATGVAFLWAVFSNAMIGVFVAFSA